MKSKLLAIAVSSIIVALVANASYANMNKRPNLDGLVYWHGDLLIRHADRSHIVKALPFIIESLQKKGYEFVTVPKLIGLED